MSHLAAITCASLGNKPGKPAKTPTVLFCLSAVCFLSVPWHVKHRAHSWRVISLVHNGTNGSLDLLFYNEILSRFTFWHWSMKCICIFYYTYTSFIFQRQYRRNCAIVALLIMFCFLAAKHIPGRHTLFILRSPLLKLLFSSSSV